MKLRLRMIAVILAVVMMTSTLASCGLLDGFGDTDGGGEKSIHGSTVGNVYKNEYFDLSLTLPAHWVFEDKEK